tara:strand:+ start:2630 stop:3046 length:417 start_codon:yes stop_codon:yes gene_type:complete
MEEEFYAVIKLISGEEIFSKVCPCEEEDRTILLLDNPVTIETFNMRQMGVSGLKINPWIKYTDDSMFVMDMDRVITMSEVTDEDMLFMYAKYLKKKHKKPNVSNKPSESMGYLKSITEARVSLEKIFNESGEKDTKES